MSGYISCIFCDEHFDFEDLKIHSATCPKHPAVLELATYRENNGRYFEQLCSFREQLTAIERELSVMPDAIRAREGGGPENFAMSIALTFESLRHRAEKAESTYTLGPVAKPLAQAILLICAAHETDQKVTRQSYIAQAREITTTIFKAMK